MWNCAEWLFAADHPSAAGHFPGNPIIPGAVLLAETIEAIETVIGSPGPGYDIQSAKFLHPVRPGDRVLIRWRGGDGGGVKFECSRMTDQRMVLVGILRLNGERL